MNVDFLVHVRVLPCQQRSFFRVVISAHYPHGVLAELVHAGAEDNFFLVGVQFVPLI